MRWREADCEPGYDEDLSPMEHRAWQPPWPEARARAERLRREVEAIDPDHAPRATTHHEPGAGRHRTIGRGYRPGSLGPGPFRPRRWLAHERRFDEGRPAADERGPGRTEHPSGGEFRPRRGEYRTRGGEFRPRRGEYRTRGGEFRPRRGEYRTRGGEFVPRRGEYQARDDEFGPRRGEYRTPGREFGPRRGEYRTRGDEVGPWRSEYRPRRELGPRRGEVPPPDEYAWREDYGVDYDRPARRRSAQWRSRLAEWYDAEFRRGPRRLRREAPLFPEELIERYRPHKAVGGFSARGIHTYDLDYGRQAGGPTTEYSGRAGLPTDEPARTGETPLEPAERSESPYTTEPLEDEEPFTRERPRYERWHWSMAEPADRRPRRRRRRSDRD